MKKNELLLFATPLLVLMAIVLSTAGTKYAKKVRRSQETVTVRAGVFNKEASSRVLLKKLSRALKDYPEHSKFEVRWHVNTKSSNGGEEQQMLTFTYNRHDAVLEQGEPGGFRYRRATEAAIHDIAKNDKTVGGLTPNNYTRVHIFTEKQRLEHGIEILPTEHGRGVITTVKKQP